ncbi:hypothetical protein HAP94_24135 [Acidithiobacillus ferrivorans]|nr:hypothetical protein [Acidithiobacillus ferrivorans]
MKYIDIGTFAVALATLYLGLQTRKQNKNYHNSERLKLKPYCIFLPQDTYITQAAKNLYMKVYPCTDGATNELSAHEFVIVVMGKIKNHGAYPARNIELGILIDSGKIKNKNIELRNLTQVPVCQLLSGGESADVICQFFLTSKEPVTDPQDILNLNRNITNIEMLYCDVIGDNYMTRKNFYTIFSSDIKNNVLPDEFFTVSKCKKDDGILTSKLKCIANYFNIRNGPP